jgi:branched-chain amino acid transport system permease protein
VKRARLVALAAAAVLLPFGMSGGQLTTATFVLIAAIGAVGLNVLTGYTGQISLGHAFFLAAGAYTAAVLGGNDGVSAIVWIPAAGVVAALCGVIVGPTAVRLRGLYLAIVTIGLVFIGQHILFNVTSLSGGPQGRSIPAVQAGGFDFSPGQVLRLGSITIDHDGLYYYLALALLALSLAYVANLSRTRFGRAMEAVRDGELAAAVMGVHLTKTKLGSFAISSFLAGISGALFASYLSFVQPSQWNLLLSIQYLAAIIVGGIGTVWGPVLGSIFVFALPDLLKSLPFVSESGAGGVPLTDLTSIVYGVLIVVVFIVEPHGLVGLGSRLRVVTTSKEASP